MVTDDSFESLRSRANSAWNNMSKISREVHRKVAKEIGFDRIEEKVEQIKDSFLRIQLRRREIEAEKKHKIEEYLEQTFKGNNYSSQEFILAHANFRTFVKNDFYIIEVGLLKYSLDEGIIDHIHFMYDSGKLPIGHEFQALKISENTHQLPVTKSDFGIKSIEAKKMIEKFLDIDKDQFIFTLNEGHEIAAITDMFIKIVGHNYCVIPLEKLFCLLSLNLNKTTLSDEKARDFLIDNPWNDYHIGCKYHSDIDASKFCSLAK